MTFNAIGYIILLEKYLLLDFQPSQLLDLNITSQIISFQVNIKSKFPVLRTSTVRYHNYIFSGLDLLLLYGNDIPRLHIVTCSFMQTTPV